MPPDARSAPLNAAKMTAPALWGAVPVPWREPLALLAVAMAVLFAVTLREWGEMLHQWWDIDTYNHILLVPLIVVWLVWLKADELAEMAPRASVWGLGLVAAALCLWLTGRVTDINLFAQAGAVGALQGAIVAILGVRLSWFLALPLAYLALLVPFGDEVIPFLQAITAQISIALTLFSGVPAQIDGIYIDTPAGLFIVAEECSGVKFLIAMVTLAVLIAFTRFKSWSRRAMLMLAAVVVPVFANGVRAWGTIYIAQFAGLEFAAGFDHIIYGWVFFAIVVALVLAGAWRFFESEPEDYGFTLGEVAEQRWIARLEGRSQSPLAVLGAIAALAAIAGVAAVAFAPASLS
ncbi:MAG: exosortase A [Pseudomonadota bacterium]